MKTFGGSTRTFILILIAVVIILAWSGLSRIQDFRDYHLSIARNTTGNVSESVSKFIIEQKRLVSVFASNNKSLIASVSKRSETDDYITEVDSNLRKFFPKYFSFTVTDKQGTPYIEDFDGLIGDLCLSDIKNYSEKNINVPRVHPHPDIYHYDILSRFNHDGEEYIFFVTFPADEIASYLKSTQAPGHKTMLVLESENNLIEVTDAGARNVTYRPDYRLKENELALVLSSKQVIGTKWHSYDFADPLLVVSFRNNIILESGAIFSFVLIIGVLMFFLLKKEEERRRKAEAVKDEFVSIVSHELRTPLTSINGSIKLIENGVIGKIDDEVKKFLGVASVNITRLTTIVNDILDVKKIEAGELELFLKECSINEIVEQAVKENLEYAHELNANIVYTQPETDYIVEGDRNRLIQVMTNLISNAVKYGCENDNVRVYISGQKRHVKVSVEDHGPGLDIQDKDYLFEKFTQYHSRDKEVVQGTGLGLSIARTIIEKHDGLVSFDSVKNKGTTFYIVLPLVAEQ